MRIIFIAGTLGQGGAEKQLFLLCKSLIENKWDVSVLCLTSGEFWERKLNENGIPVIWVGKSSNRWKRLAEIIRLTYQYNPDIIYSFHFYTSFYAAVAGRLNGVFSIGSIRNDGFSEKRANGLMSFLHFRLPNAIIANSQHGMLNAKSAFKSENQKISILNNAIDLKKYQFKLKEISPNSGITICFIGRLVDQKRPIKCLEIIKTINDIGILKKGLIIGDGPLKKMLQEYISDNKLEHKISIIGKVNDIRPYLYKSDFLISCSSAEGTPNVILEAMACGTSILAQDYQGITNLLIDGEEIRGTVFSSRTHAVESVMKLLKSPNLTRQYSDNARNYLEKSFSTNILYLNFQTTLKEIGFALK